MEIARQPDELRLALSLTRSAAAPPQAMGRIAGLFAEHPDGAIRTRERGK
jgi:hypothetical protein